MSLPGGSPPRRPVLVPVIIAAVFLTIIGASVGLALGARSQDRPAASPATAPVGPGSAPVEEPSERPSERPADEPPAQEPSDEPGAPACREETQAAGAAAGVAGRLTVVAHRIYSRSDVWICAAENGALYYHANRASGNGEWIEGDTALFLPGVERRDQTFVARNPTPDGDFVFEVRPKELRITDPRSEVEVQPLRG